MRSRLLVSGRGGRDYKHLFIYLSKTNRHVLFRPNMSPRPKTISDEDVLGAASQAILRRGPANVTLADVAKETGLSPATLVQRFGSKRGLLLALARSGVDGVDACFAAIREQHPSPMDALVAAATHMARMATSPEELANGLAFLQLDLSDKAFRALALENSERILAGYRALLDGAVASGDLAPCDTKALARAIGALSGGSLIGWAIHREGTAEKWVKADLETLLAPYRLGRTRGAKRRKRA
jgi:AcrR family transcriptional regulator